MSEGNVRRVENHTHRIIMLPALMAETEEGQLVSYEQGISLRPGLNTVPTQYLDALAAKESDTAPPKGAKPGKVYPRRKSGEKLLAQLMEPVRIVTIDGSHFGPQITIYEPDQVEVAGKPDGPELPPDLNAYSKRASMELIQKVGSKDVLRSWARLTKDAAVKQAAQAKLISLGG